MKPDLAQATAFLNALDPSGIFTFQTFDDKGRKPDPLAGIFHGTLAQHAEEMEKRQQKGAGVFVMVNQGDGVTHEGQRSCRTAASVIRVRALFADLDGEPLQPVIDTLQPDIVIESSPDRWHAYWVTSDCPLDEFSKRQKQIAARFKSDPKVCDLPRVMRLPGFFHQKSEPFMTHMIFPEGAS